jgi:hypothetical protein
MALKGRNPTKAEKIHMDRVCQLGCIVCRNQGVVGVPAEIHHVYGKTKLNAHTLVLPLCFEHHRQGGMEEPFISRHPYKKRFEKSYGTEEELLRQVEKFLGCD